MFLDPNERESFRGIPELKLRGRKGSESTWRLNRENGEQSHPTPRVGGAALGLGS